MGNCHWIEKISTEDPQGQPERLRRSEEQLGFGTLFLFSAIAFMFNFIQYGSGV